MVMAALTLAGFPFTTGMPARALAEPINVVMMFLLVVANSLAVACVFLSWSEPVASANSEEPRPTMAVRRFAGGRVNWPVLRLLLALGLALVPSLLWGFFPSRLAESADFAVALSFGQLLRQLGLIRLMGPFVILALAIGLARLLSQPEARPELWRNRLATATGLTWVLGGLRWAALWGEIGWRNALFVFEGEGYFGWIVLLAVLAWLVIRI